MTSIIIAIILFVSLIALTVIILRKIPLLLQLPETGPFRFSWKEWLSKAKESSFLRNFSFEIFLQKILTKVRLLTLKTDNKTSNWLQRLRARGQKKNNDETDNYWQQIKNHTGK